MFSKEDAFTEVLYIVSNALQTEFQTLSCTD